MPIFRQSISIHASRTHDWRVLANAEQFNLQSNETREEITSVQKQGVGTTLRVVRRIAFLSIALDGRMTEWVDAQVMASEWSSGLPFAITTRVRMELFDEDDDARLEREYAVNVRLPIIGKWLEIILTRNTPREMRSLLERIKQAAEKFKGG